MDQQEEGWPLGLMRNLTSISFSTAKTFSSRSTSTSITSSNFDSESFEPKFQEKNVTLGSFIGINRRKNESWMEKKEKKKKKKSWFSLCAKPRIEVENGDDGSASLGMFLEMERKVCNLHGSSQVCHDNSCHHGLPLIFRCIRC